MLISDFFILIVKIVHWTLPECSDKINQDYKIKKSFFDLIFINKFGLHLFC